VLWVRTAHGLVTILGDQDGQSGITVEFVAEDDPGDTDQSFPETDRKIIKIDNHMRRYLTVFVDRIVLPGGTNTPIDNGPNDTFIGTSGKLFSFNTLYEYFKYITGSQDVAGPPPSSKRYLLPVPDGIEPGTEVKFRVRVQGPAFGKQLPAGGSKNPRLIAVTSFTSFEMLLLPLLSTASGTNELKGTFEKDYFDLGGMTIDQISGWESGNPITVLEPMLKFILGSNLLKNALQDALGGNYLIANIASIEDLQEVLLKPVSIGNLVNDLIHLATSRWEEEYQVLIVVPKIDEIVPNSGGAGDVVEIRGSGFDTYNIENNRVYFTDEVSGLPKVEASVRGVPSENSLIAEVPPGYYPGPVMVCTKSSIGEEIHAYCSNTDVSFLDATPASLAITFPADGGTVSGVIEVTAEVSDAPTPFPQSSAVLYVNELIVDPQEHQKEVTSSDFSFTLDTNDLNLGEHSLEVRLNLGGEVFSQFLSFVIEMPPPPGEAVYNPTTREPFVPGSYAWAGDVVNIDVCGVNAESWYVKKFRTDSSYWPEYEYNNPDKTGWEVISRLNFGRCTCVADPTGSAGNYWVQIWFAGFDGTGIRHYENPGTQADYFSSSAGFDWFVHLYLWRKYSERAFVYQPNYAYNAKIWPGYFPALVPATYFILRVRPTGPCNPNPSWP
jgi:hypothetical protein